MNNKAYKKKKQKRGWWSRGTRGRGRIRKCVGARLYTPPIEVEDENGE